MTGRREFLIFTLVAAMIVLIASVTLNQKPVFRTGSRAALPAHGGTLIELPVLI